MTRAHVHGKIGLAGQFRGAQLPMDMQARHPIPAFPDTDGLALWVARSKDWVGESELAEINALLTRLLGLLLRQPRSAQDRLVSLSWVLAPIEARSSARESDRID